MSFILLGILNAQAEAGAVGDYDLLETTILTSSASSVSFTGLGSYTDYKHLQIRYTGRCTASGSQEEFAIQVNGDTGSNYAAHRIFGNGSSVGSSAYTSQTSTFNLANLAATTSAANSFAAGVIDILDPFSTTKNTTFRALSGVTDATVIKLASGLHINTSAVSSFELTPFSGSFVTGSRFSLYGIRG